MPDDVHGVLKARAAARGSTLTEYVRHLLTRAAARPTLDELAARMSARGPVGLPEPSVDSVRRLREHGE